MFLIIKADITHRSSQPSEPLSLQSLLATSRATIVQAWKDIAQLQANLTKAMHKSKDVTKSVYKQWSDMQYKALSTKADEGDAAVI